MIGAHGYVESGMIIRLGFIAHTTNDALCPVEEVEPIVEEEEEVEPIVEEEQDIVQPTPTPEPEPE